jgi:hypothetical protein
MMKDTKDKCNAMEIRSAVLPLFKKYQLHTNSLDPFNIPSDELPSVVRSLPLFSEHPEQIVAWFSGSKNDVLMIETGSGFGHWGIAVCEDTGDRHLLKYHQYITPWAVGIYFYRGD